MTFPKKISISLISFLSLFLVVFTFPTQVAAQLPLPINANICDILNTLGLFASNPPWYSDNVCGFSDKVFNSPEDELYGERYTFAQVGWIVHSLLLQSPMGYFFNHSIWDFVRQVFTQNPTSPDLAKFGLPGMIMGSISYMVEHPVASGVEYSKQTLAKLNLVQPVHAQGYGFSQLSSIQWLWQASRNSAYLVVVILLIASAFAILFRLKINPQTAITIQLLIPRLIITLIGITFSYAIGGFIIDLIFVAISLFVAAISLGSGINFSYVTPLLTANFGVFSAVYLVVLLILTIFQLVFQNTGGAIAFLIFFIIIIFLLLKIWWMLLKTYVTLIALIIFGPWLIMLGVIPTNPGFSGWVRNTVAQAAVFVVVPIMFFFNLIFWIAGSAPGGLVGSLLSALAGLLPAPIDGIIQNLLTIPSGNLPALPLMASGASGSNLIYLGIGFVFLAVTPKVAEMVRDYLKVPSFKYGSALGEAVSAPIGFTSNVSQNMANYYRGQSQPETEATWRNLAEGLSRAARSIKGN